MRALMIGLVALLATTGCGERESIWNKDGDPVGQGDCDDDDPTRYPGAPELCDGKDNDCDDHTDEEPEDGRWWYPDRDGDELGDHATSDEDRRWACFAPEINWVDNNRDCDDFDFETKDQLTSYYPDGDGDGAPVEGTAINACTPPEGHADSERGWDCDDSNPDVHPGAEEDCNDIDDDCDGLVDLDDPSLQGEGRWFADLDMDGFGDDEDYILDCEPQRGRVTTGGDCNDLDNRVHPGAAEIPYDGRDNDCVDGDACDLDGDGEDYLACGGPDCIDDPDWREADLRARDVNSKAEEKWYDGVDQDCVGDDDYDQDHDGYRCDPSVAASCFGMDFECDPSPAVNGCDCLDNPLIDGELVNPDQWEVFTPHYLDEDCDSYVNEVVVDESWHLAATYADRGGHYGSGDGSHAGSVIVPLGDYDSDGYDDYVHGTSLYGLALGDVELVSGRTASSVTGPGTGKKSWNGLRTATYFGASIAPYRDGSGNLTHLLVGQRGYAYFVPLTGTFSSSSPRVAQSESCKRFANIPMTVALIDDGIYATASPDCGQVSVWASAPGTGSTFTMGSSPQTMDLYNHTQLGLRMAAGDLDQDGDPDLVMTTEGEDYVAIVVQSKKADFGKEDYYTRDPVYVGAAFSDEHCAVDDDHPRTVAVLDFDGDGKDDLAIGCPGYDDGLSNRDGAVFIINGRAGFSSMTSLSSGADWVFWGVDGALGATLGSAGDLLPSVVGEELLVGDPGGTAIYLVGQDASSGSDIDKVAMPFKVGTASPPINAVGVGQVNGSDGPDVAFAFEGAGLSSTIHLLTWGP